MCRSSLVAHWRRQVGVTSSADLNASVKAGCEGLTRVMLASSWRSVSSQELAQILGRTTWKCDNLGSRELRLESFLSKCRERWTWLRSLIIGACRTESRTLPGTFGPSCEKWCMSRRRKWSGQGPAKGGRRVWEDANPLTVILLNSEEEICRM